jgi:hypothetical protein
MTGSNRENVDRMLNSRRDEKITSRISSYHCLERRQTLRALIGVLRVPIVPIEGQCSGLTVRNDAERVPHNAG